ncbi:MAG TPA: efflux RND transporter periplasmic adaptor subunit [Candidatus Bathyarchaeia archaeon]|nr:efflux RND transporter periplasmic adaptor subunit [Candidatus Bathyarchaeia archaeon]
MASRKKTADRIKNLFSLLKTKKKLVIFLALLFIGGLLIRKRLLSGKNVIRTDLVKREVLQETVSANGQIEARNKANLHFPTSSKVTWIGVTAGQEVKKWQGIAAVDRRQLEKALRQKLLDYSTTRWDFEQTQDKYKVAGRSLSDITLTPEEKRILEKSQFGLDRAVLDVEIADIAAREAVLVSPMNGTVVAVENLVVGENLTPTSLTTSYVRIVDFSSLYFKAKVDEVDYAKIQIGQAVKVSLDAFSEKEVSGKVVFIGKEGVESSAGVMSIPVEISLEKTEEPLITGLNGEAKFAVSQKADVLVIPREFLIFEGDKNFVYVSENGRLQKRYLQTGLKTATQVEIVEGLQEGETVALLK